MLDRTKIRSLANAALLDASLCDVMPGRDAVAARSRERLYRIATPEVIAELCATSQPTDPDVGAFRRAIGERLDPGQTDAIVQRAREIAYARRR